MTDGKCVFSLSGGETHVFLIEQLGTYECYKIREDRKVYAVRTMHTGSMEIVLD